MEVGRAASIFRYYGSEGWRMDGIAPPSARPGVTHSSVREPLGVVGLITPWNFPLAIPSWKMAPALICGNTIVIKPASNASLNAAALVRILAEAGLPDGVVNMVTGPGGSRRRRARHRPAREGPLVHGLDGAWASASRSGPSARRSSSRWAARTPIVVMEDADLSDAAAKVSFGAFGYAGEKCTASSRAIVVEEVYDEFIEKLKSATEAMKVGDPLDEDTDIGPVVNKSQYESILEALETAKTKGAWSSKAGRRAPRTRGTSSPRPSSPTWTTRARRRRRRSSAPSSPS